MRLGVLDGIDGVEEILVVDGLKSSRPARNLTTCTHSSASNNILYTSRHKEEEKAWIKLGKAGNHARS
jgi:hypothetical protein